MPELPDVVYLVRRLSPLLQGQRVTFVKVEEPVVVRMLLPGDFVHALIGCSFLAVGRKGPFLVFALDDTAIAKLYHCIIEVMRWGIAEVERAAPALDGKFREHMRVRNRKGQPCPNCGAKIRRAGVLGYDTFFCPTCQPLMREYFIDWRKIPKKQ